MTKDKKITFELSFRFHISRFRVELPKRVIRLDLLWVNDLVSQPNPAHFLASQKNSNPARPTTG